METTSETNLLNCVRYIWRGESQIPHGSIKSLKQGWDSYKLSFKVKFRLCVCGSPSGVVVCNIISIKYLLGKQGLRHANPINKSSSNNAEEKEEKT